MEEFFVTTLHARTQKPLRGVVTYPCFFSLQGLSGSRLIFLNDNCFQIFFLPTFVEKGKIHDIFNCLAINF